jgi:hypothetical protein
MADFSRHGLQLQEKHDHQWLIGGCMGPSVPLTTLTEGEIYLEYLPCIQLSKGAKTTGHNLNDVNRFADICIHLHAEVTPAIMKQCDQLQSIDNRAFDIHQRTYNYDKFSC